MQGLGGPGRGVGGGALVAMLRLTESLGLEQDRKDEAGAGIREEVTVIVRESEGRKPGDEVPDAGSVQSLF